MGRPVKKHLDSILERQEQRRLEKATHAIQRMAEQALIEAELVLRKGAALSTRQEGESLLAAFELEQRDNPRLTREQAIDKVLRSRDGKRVWKLIHASTSLEQSDPVSVRKANQRQTDAEGELENMARRERQRDPSLTHARAMDRVLRTPECRALQEKITQSMREAASAGMPASGWDKKPTDQLARILEKKRVEFEQLAKQVIAPNLDVSARQQILKRMQEIAAE